MSFAGYYYKKFHSKLNRLSLLAFEVFYEFSNKLCLIIDYGTNFQMTPLVHIYYTYRVVKSLSIKGPRLEESSSNTA